MHVTCLLPRKRLRISAAGMRVGASTSNVSTCCDCYDEVRILVSEMQIACGSQLQLYTPVIKDNRRLPVHCVPQTRPIYYNLFTLSL